MPQTVPTALFFHGLNTYKDDLLHLGPVNLGRMDRFLKPGLESRGIRMLSIDGIGVGTPESQAIHASEQIANRFRLEHGTKVQLLGNSMGGLVIRALAQLWKNEPQTNPLRLEIDKLISWGAPHLGSVVATWGQAKKNSTFQHYTPAALEKFNEKFPLNGVAREYYFLCVASWLDVSPYFWPMSLAQRIVIGRGAKKNDGFILADSQRWGESCGTFALDHFGQTGFHSILPMPSQRAKSRIEFERLCDRMAELIKVE